MAQLTKPITSPRCPPSGPIVRSAYRDHQVDVETPRRRVSSFVSGPTRVRQEFVAESDINNVVLRYAGTGELPPHVNHGTPIHADVSDVPDLHTALQRVRDAEAQLDELRAAQAQAAARATNPSPVPSAGGTPPASSPAASAPPPASSPGPVQVPPPQL